MKIVRRKTRVVRIGRVSIGADYPVAIQSMTKYKSSDIVRIVRQIKELERAGCEIVRLAVKDNLDARAIKKVKAQVKVPLVADIHFDYRFAIVAIENGIDKIRLNPGNIGKKEEIREVISAARGAGIPVRVGLNSGSVKYSHLKNMSMADKLVRSALDYIREIEKMKFYNLVISLKANNCLDTIAAYRKISKLCDYPLHLGVTATGFPYGGAIKSSVAIGALLLDGIGDTIRVSLTEEPVREVQAAKAILEAVELRRFGPKVISCPTCGRCEVDLVKIVQELENRLSTIDYRLSTKPPKVAIMGCVVNGPGEAKEADIGVAFGKKEGLLFKKGKAVKKISYSNCVDTLIKEILKN